MKKAVRLNSFALRLPKKQGMKGNVSELEWSDGKVSCLSAFSLRMHCPCAACRNTGGPKGVPSMVEIKEQNPVGSYAVNYVFSDGHYTGIYTYALLREIDESSNQI